MLKNFLLEDFKKVENTSQFSKDFVENYNEVTDESYFYEDDVPYLKKLQDIHDNLTFLAERMKIEKVEKLVVKLHDKKEI